MKHMKSTVTLFISHNDIITVTVRLFKFKSVRVGYSVSTVSWCWPHDRIFLCLLEAESWSWI